MRMIQKLKQFERQVVFLRWGNQSDYGKLKYVGADFLEFEVLDAESMEYAETIVINAQMVLEMVVGGTDIHRILVEFASRLPAAEDEQEQSERYL